jgi:hypothetical protein
MLGVPKACITLADLLDGGWWYVKGIGEPSCSCTLINGFCYGGVVNIRGVRQYKNAIMNQVNMQLAKSNWDQLTQSHVRAQSATLSGLYERWIATGSVK